jgi:hypothetical protein
MINRTKQNWIVGATVKVGFMNLIVKAAVATPGDYLPDAYILANVQGTQLYKFVPHNGIEKITVSEGREMLESAKNYVSKLTAIAIAKVSQPNVVDALFA